VAGFGEGEIVELLGNAGIIRSRAKIEATIGGARAYLEMLERGEGFTEF
jgi:DNA-3-methyladenine glycosylase I